MLCFAGGQRIGIFVTNDPVLSRGFHRGLAYWILSPLKGPIIMQATLLLVAALIYLGGGLGLRRRYCAWAGNLHPTALVSLLDGCPFGRWED